MKEKGNYVDDKLDGKYVWYYENGKVKKRTYKDGKEEGKWVEYDEEGNIKDEDIYKDGVCVWRCVRETKKTTSLLWGDNRVNIKKIALFHRPI